MMKGTFKFVVLLLLSCFAYTTTSAQTFTPPEQFAQKVFNSLKAKDLEAYKKLFISKQEYEKLIESSTLHETKKMKEVEDIENDLKSLLINLKPSYDDIIKQGEDLGIEWANTSFKDADYDLFKKDGIYTCYVFVKFEYKGLTYELKLGKGYLVGSEWKMKTTPSLIR